ncbi:MAG: hypothetical protein RL434_2935 [Pseudomonadota bacterium]
MTEPALSRPADKCRVVLALEEAGAPDFLFELAALLARAQSSGLLAQVRENVDLGIAAALPFVQQIDRRSAASRAWTPAHVSQARARTERQWQQRLAALGRANLLQAELEWVHGSRRDFLIGGLSSHDVMVFGSRRDDGQAGELRIAAVCRAHQVNQTVIAAAQSMSEAMGAGVQVLQAGRSDSFEGLPPAARAMRVEESLEAVMAAAAAVRARILVLPRTLCGPDASGAVEAFLARPGRCIVVMP